MPVARPKTCPGTSTRSTPEKAGGLPWANPPGGTADRGLAPQSVRRRSTTTGVATGAGDASLRSRDKRGLSFCLLSLHLSPGLNHPPAQLPGKLDNFLLPSVRVPVPASPWSASWARTSRISPMACSIISHMVRFITPHLQLRLSIRRLSFLADLVNPLYQLLSVTPFLMEGVALWFA